MSEFAPVSTLQDLSLQDDAEMMAGYRAGFAGEPAPFASTFSRAYTHGWRNGAVDGGHIGKDAAQALLAHAFTTAQACGDALQGDSTFCRLPIQ